MVAVNYLPLDQTFTAQSRAEVGDLGISWSLETIPVDLCMLHAVPEPGVHNVIAGGGAVVRSKPRTFGLSNILRMQI